MANTAYWLSMANTAYGAVLAGLLTIVNAQTLEEAKEVSAIMKPYALTLTKVEFMRCLEEANYLLLKHPGLLMKANTDVLMNLDQIIEGE